MAGNLSHTPAEIVAQLMRLWDPTLLVYDTNEPDQYDLVTTVYDTEGRSDGRAMVDGELWDHVGIQARIRSSQHLDGERLANRIRTFWAQSINQAVIGMLNDDGTPDGSRYLIWCLSKIGQVICIGKNVPPTKRSIFTINALTTIDELAPPN